MLPAARVYGQAPGVKPHAMDKTNELGSPESSHTLTVQFSRAEASRGASFFRRDRDNGQKAKRAAVPVDKATCVISNDQAYALLYNEMKHAKPLRSPIASSSSSSCHSCWGAAPGEVVYAATADRLPTHHTSYIITASKRSQTHKGH